MTPQAKEVIDYVDRNLDKIVLPEQTKIPKGIILLVTALMVDYRIGEDFEVTRNAIIDIWQKLHEWHVENKPDIYVKRKVEHNTIWDEVKMQ